MDQLDQTWVMNRHAHEYRGDQAIEVTRLAGRLVQAYLHEHESRPRLPFGGYYALGRLPGRRRSHRAQSSPAPPPSSPTPQTPPSSKTLATAEINAPHHPHPQRPRWPSPAAGTHLRLFTGQRIGRRASQSLHPRSRRGSHRRPQRLERRRPPPPAPSLGALGQPSSRPSSA